jgi:hypothetical protein
MNSSSVRRTPDISFLLKIRQVVVAVDTYGVKLEVAGADTVFLEPFVHHQLYVLVFRQLFLIFPLYPYNYST